MSLVRMRTHGSLDHRRCPLINGACNKSLKTQYSADGVICSLDDGGGNNLTCSNHDELHCALDDVSFSDFASTDVSVGVGGQPTKDDMYNY